MDAQTLVKAMPGLSLSRASQLVNGCNAAMQIGEINTVRRCAMFLAQIGHESVSLQYKQEIQPPPGADYPPYIGRTFIQVTWDYNYRDFGQWCHRKNLLSDSEMFVKHPTYLAADQWAWLGPIWYWTVARPTLNTMADAGDMYGCTLAINGGLNGLSDRQYRYGICMRLGTAILPTKTPQRQEDDVPTELHLWAEDNQTRVPTDGRWIPVHFGHASPKSGGQGPSMVLGKTAHIFSMTAWLNVTDLGPDQNLFIRVQTLDRNNKPMGQFPISELRGTSGTNSSLSFSQIGSVRPASNLRLLVSASKRGGLINHASWRALTW